jgi:NADP-dependent 3-hydroxy acid dehydrogenase YdfG
MIQEYLVKLISIDRRQEELEQKADEFGKAADKLLSNTKKFDTELNKMLKDLRRKRI